MTRLHSTRTLLAATLVLLPMTLRAQAPEAPAAPLVGIPAGQTQQTPAQYAASLKIGDPRQPLTSQPGAMTLAQVIDAARAKNPTLVAAERNLEAVRAQEIQAAVRQNPNFTLYGTNVTLPAQGASNPYAYSFQVSRLFELGGKRGDRIAAAKATTAQTAALLEDQQRQTILQVKLAFTQMLEAKASLQLTTALLDEFQHEVDIAQERYKRGDLAKIDFERLDLQLASFESDESNDIVNLRQASDQLQTLMGVETPSAQFDIAGDIVPPTLTTTREALIQAALDKRPDFAAARHAVDAAAANQKLAYAYGLTDPTLEGEYDRSGTDNSAGFSISVPLRIFDRNQGNKKTAVFQTQAAQFAATAAHNQVISDVDQAWIAYTQAHRLSDRYSGHYLDETRDVLNIAQFAFEHGGIALIDYIDAVRDTRSTDEAALAAYQQTWQAIHQLSAASATEVAP